MIKLVTIDTGSQNGNCHFVTDGNEILILDLGVSIKKIKQAIDFNVSSIVGAIVTHNHQDHSLSVNDVKAMGKQVFRPYERKDRAERVRTACGKFIVDAFALTDVNCTKFVHTNAYGDECPCYAFLIRHTDYPDWSLFYATDCQYIKWKIPKVKNILLGTNYDLSKMCEADDKKIIHVLAGHLSLENAIEFIKANSEVENVILTHLSSSNANADVFLKKVNNEVNTNVLIATKGLSVILKGDD